MKSLDDLLNKGEFAGRHLGSDEAAQRQMLETLKVGSLDALVREVVPAGILLKEPLALGEAMREPEANGGFDFHETNPPLAKAARLPPCQGGQKESAVHTPADLA